MHFVRHWLVFVVFPRYAVDNSFFVAGAYSMFSVAVGGLGAFPYPALCFWIYLDLPVDACLFAGVESPRGVGHDLSIHRCQERFTYGTITITEGRHVSVDHMRDWVNKYPESQEKIKQSAILEKAMKLVGPPNKLKNEVGDEEWNELISRLTK